MTWQVVGLVSVLLLVLNNQAKPWVRRVQSRPLQVLLRCVPRGSPKAPELQARNAEQST